MASYQSYSTVFSEQLGGSDEQILVTIEYGADFTGDGFDDIRVTLALAPGSNSGTEDVIGVAFGIRDNAVAGLGITDIQTATGNGTLSGYSASHVIGADMVAGNGALDPGFNTSGGGSDAPYDVGVMASLPGSGEGIVQSFSFVLTDPAGDLDAEVLLENTDWWVRVQSTDGGGDSAKTAGFIDDLPSPGDGEEIDLGDGTGNTPGFWKNHATIFGQETGLDLSDSFETLFGVDVAGSRKLSDDPSLDEALRARRRRGSPAARRHRRLGQRGQRRRQLRPRPGGAGTGRGGGVWPRPGQRGYRRRSGRGDDHAHRHAGSDRQQCRRNPPGRRDHRRGARCL